ncbi:MAG: hypothetical protein ABFS56_00660 [Pseudomonadota bacterium]
MMRVRTAQQLPLWGEALFKAVFLQDRTAQDLSRRLQDEDEEKRYVTISAVFPEVAGEEALNSVAARLVHAGIPSVLAMTYSVLVTTARLLNFSGQVYAVNSLALVLAESLLDAEAAKQALAQVPTLIILDNVESLAAAPLAELLRWQRNGRNTRLSY